MPQKNTVNNRDNNGNDWNNTRKKFQKRRFRDPITFDTFPMRNAIVLNKQLYHPRSLLQWIARSPTVPMTRRQLNNNELYTIRRAVNAMNKGAEGHVPLHELLAPLPRIREQLIRDLADIRAFFDLTQILRTSHYRYLTQPSDFIAKIQDLVKYPNPELVESMKAKGFKIDFFKILGDTRKPLALNTRLSSARALNGSRVQMQLWLFVVRPKYTLDYIVTSKGKIHQIYFEAFGLWFMWTPRHGWDFFDENFVGNNVTYVDKDDVKEMFRSAYSHVFPRSNSSPYPASY